MRKHEIAVIVVSIVILVLALAHVLWAEPVVDMGCYSRCIQGAGISYCKQFCTYEQ